MSPARPTLRRRLPGILAEIVSVIFAVLVALTADEWWEEREQVADAQRLTQAILEEIRGNREELLGSGEPTEADRMEEALDSAISVLRAGGRPEGLSVNWDVALLSSAAWDAAQVSGATRHMELEALIDLAQVYEFQRIYGSNQDQLVSLIAETPAGMEAAPMQTLLTLRSRMAVASELRETLATVYACRLAALEGSDAPESGECPSDAHEPLDGRQP